MNRFILSFLFLSLLVPACLRADEPEQPQTLITGPIHHGYYGALVTKVSRIDGEAALLMGGKFTWVVNRRFGIGFAGYGRVDGYDWNYSHGKSDWNIHLGYGGLYLEANFLPLKVIHFNTGLLLGGGGRVGNFNTDVFFAVEPEINMTVNVTRYFSIDLGVGYRFVGGINTASTSNEKMSGPSAALTLKFGRN